MTGETKAAFHPHPIVAPSVSPKKLTREALEEILKLTNERGNLELVRDNVGPGSLVQIRRELRKGDEGRGCSVYLELTPEDVEAIRQIVLRRIYMINKIFTENAGLEIV